MRTDRRHRHRRGVGRERPIIDGVLHRLHTRTAGLVRSGHRHRHRTRVVPVRVLVPRERRRHRRSRRVRRLAARDQEIPVHGELVTRNGAEVVEVPGRKYDLHGDDLARGGEDVDAQVVDRDGVRHVRGGPVVQDDRRGPSRGRRRLRQVLDPVIGGPGQHLLRGLSHGRRLGRRLRHGRAVLHGFVRGRGRGLRGRGHWLLRHVHGLRRRGRRGDDAGHGERQDDRESCLQSSAWSCTHMRTPCVHPSGGRG